LPGRFWKATPSWPALSGNSPIFRLRVPLVLASDSPRRRAFLRDLNLPARLVSPRRGAEPVPLPDESPEHFVLRAASAKAASCLPLLSADAKALRLPADSLIIAADTIVVFNGRILGKPADRAEALEFLRLLAGRSHEVLTACVLESQAKRESFLVRTRVALWSCPDALLVAYASGDEPLDKAGAYAVQGQGAFLVKSLQGSWSNVAGLPLAELVQALLRMGALAQESAFL
jgi:septum formation protein